MNLFARVAGRVYARTFYEANALALLLLFGFAGGVLSGKEHMALALIFTGGPLYTLIPFSVWILYASKIILYNRSMSRLPQTAVIRNLEFVPGFTRWRVALWTVAQQCLPFVLYGIFLAAVGIQQGSILSAVVILLEIAVALEISELALRREWSLKSDVHVASTPLVRRATYPLMAVEWLLRQVPGLVVVTKVFNGFLLYGICRLHAYDEYDIRLLTIAILMVSGTSAFILHYLLRFDHHAFRLLRNLPISIHWRVFSLLAVISILLLPEFLILRWNWPSAHSGWEFLLLAGAALALQFAAYTHLMRRWLSPDQFAQQIFISVLGLFILILFRLPVPVIVLAAMAYGLMFSRRYYQFEWSGTEIRTPSACR